MSYHEENNQVILTMSREDYSALLCELNLNREFSHPHGLIREQLDGLLNRLNSGNPNYTPYRTGEKKS